jgi:uncharacterized membrane protein
MNRLVRAAIPLRIASLSALLFSAMSAIGLYAQPGSFCAPGSQCDQVHHSSVGLAISAYLPLLGALTYTLTFVGSLVNRAGTQRLVGAIVIAGAVGGLVFLGLQAFVIGAWCWICVGADVSAIVAGLCAIPFLRSKAPRDGIPVIRSPWWAAWVIAVGAPICWVVTFPDPLVPAAIRELYRDNVIDVVEVADFGCPHCRAMNPHLQEALRGRRDVRLTRVMVPMAEARRVAIDGYYCAVARGRGDAMADKLFTIDEFSRDAVVAAGVEIGMNEAELRACFDDVAIQARSQADEQRAERADIPGVPIVYIEDRQLLGFHEGQTAATYREAIVDAGKRRVNYWSPAALLVLVALAFYWGRGGQGTITAGSSWRSCAACLRRCERDRRRAR